MSSFKLILFFSLLLSNNTMRKIEDIRHENLLTLISKHGTVKSFADAISKSEAQVSQWKSRSLNSGTKKPRNISSSMCREIETALKLKDGWMDADHTSNVSDVPDQGEIPLISWVQAGQWCGVIDNFQPGDAEEWVKCPVNHSPATYALRVRGESMYNPLGYPSFREKDIIFVDPSREFINKSLVIVRKNGDETATFKQLIIEGKSMYLQALNPNWPEKIIELSDDSVICGVVIAKLETF